MIKFFRKIRQKLLSENKVSKYLIYAIGEIVLVVIGILIALQINNVNENKKEIKLANTYLENLKLDLKSDIKALKLALTDLDFYEKKGYYSLNVLEGKVEKIDTIEFLKSLVWNNHYHLQQPSTSTYEDLISSGNIKLISNNDLKVALSKYYLKNDWMAQFGQRAKETYWLVMREEIFKSVDPFMMGAFYESEYYPNKIPTIKYADINVDFSTIKTHESLRNGIKRALSLRVWHRNELQNSLNEVDNLLAILGEE
jgi:hypothetical protein